jgi:ATP-dependent helicase HrpB
MTPLPIDAILPEALTKLRESRALVLVAEPGAGKTTRVPPAILRNGLLNRDHPHLILLQPRRVAARAAAARIADENAWQLGREIGYQIRFERRISEHTRLHVMTEGILTRRLLDDPILEGVGAVILDEFHERSLHTDLAIALLKEVRDTVRPDLMLIVMSATLDAQPVARFLGDAPIVTSAGRAFPVEVHHAGSIPRRDLPARIARIIADRTDGDVLVFLPGVAEIHRTIDALQPLAEREDLLLLPLHGALAGDEQMAALRPSARRKIVVATNIAETSLTIDGVTTVIDSGLSRVAGYDPARGMDRLELRRISRASADQRAGRAGRTRPGTCIRLWSPGEERAMDDFQAPEIRRVDLCGTVLALHAWGHPDPRTFGWYEPPDERTLVSAERLLEMLGATTRETGGQITDIGRQMLALPLHPRLARLMLASAALGMLEDGAAVAALLSEKDIVRIHTDAPAHERRPSTQSDSDLLIRLEMLHSRGRDAQVDGAALRQVAKTRDELLRLAHRHLPHPVHGGQQRAAGKWSGNDELLQLPLHAYPDRVCRRRAGDASAAAMVGGAGVRRAPECTVRQAEFFLALDARQDERNPAREATVRIASAIELDWLERLFPHEIRRERMLIFDAQRQRVVGRGTVRYRDLILREQADAPVDPVEAGNVLAAALAPRAAELFASDEHARALLARVALLRAHMPEHPWPAFDDAELAQVLTEACAGAGAGAGAGRRGIEELRGALAAALSARLVYPLDRLLEEQAPEALTVPSGSRIRLTYAIGQPPVLAARLQELFGWTATPRIAAGRVAVRLHLLGPNFRPVQITDDLQSFWSTTYFQVRKDLRVRYPRHAWPEDPLAAKPQAKGRHRPGG